MFRRRILLAPLALVTAASACDFPTSLPMWEQTWVVPGEALEMSVAEFLPAGVTVAPDAESFEAIVDGTAIRLTLGEMCNGCEPLNGLVAPKPEFTDTTTVVTTLPPALVAAVLAGDQIQVRARHNLSFDPLRPSDDPEAPRGFVVIEVTSAGNVVGRDSLSGHDHAFDSGTELATVLALQPVAVENEIDVTLRVHSPAGDPVFVDTSDTLGVEMLTAPVHFSEATVAASDLAVDAPAATLEFEGVDADLVERIRGGAIRLDVSNPFDLGGELVLEFVLDGGQQLSRGFNLTPGQSVTSIDFAGDDLRRILSSSEVAVRATGDLSAAGGTMTVTPAQQLVVDTRFELVLLVGGQEGES